MEQPVSHPFTAKSVRSRVGRGVRAGLVALVASFAVVSVGASDSSATGGELAVNALAPEIRTAADGAVEAYDTYMASGELADYLTYAEHRAETARLAARQLGYVEYDMIEAWRSADLQHQRAVLATMTQIGVPYRSHTSREDEGFDCSGLTYYAWGTTGLTLNRVSGDQIRAAENVGRDGAQPGDLVHYPGHVMMYLGVGDAIVHSVNTGRTVEIDTISNRRTNSVRFGDPTG